MCAWCSFAGGFACVEFLNQAALKSHCTSNGSSRGSFAPVFFLLYFIDKNPCATATNPQKCSYIYRVVFLPPRRVRDGLAPPHWSVVLRSSPHVPDKSSAGKSPASLSVTYNVSTFSGTTDPRCVYIYLLLYIYHLHKT